MLRLKIKLDYLVAPRRTVKLEEGRHTQRRQHCSKKGSVKLLPLGAVHTVDTAWAFHLPHKE